MPNQPISGKARIGYIAVLSQTAVSMPILRPLRLRCIQAGNTYMILGGRDNTEGNSLQPCLKIESQGYYQFRWGRSGTVQSISVDVKQAVNLSPRPSLYVYPNTDIGVTGVSGYGYEVFAASGAGWVTIGPVPVTGTGIGAVKVELRANYDGQYNSAPCYWDHLATS